MDQFEEARLRNAKRLERVARTQANATPVQQIQQEEKVVFIEAPEPPKKKDEAVIEVKVTLPDTTFSFRLVKPSPAKVNKNGVLNGVLNGLRPLLGEMKEQ